MFIFNIKYPGQGNVLSTSVIVIKEKILPFTHHRIFIRSIVLSNKWSTMIQHIEHRNVSQITIPNAVWHIRVNLQSADFVMDQ